MFVYLSLALLVSVALAQQPHPCRSPEDFEGRFSTFDREKRYYSVGRFAYDDRQRRFREFEEVEVGRDRDYYDKLYLYNEGKQYFVNLRTRVCNVTGLMRPWIPYAVPQDATFRGTGEVGASGVPDEHVSVNIFNGTFEGNSYFMITTGTDCIPVQSGFYSNETGGVLRDFFDITIGISDPDAFIPPSECTQQ